jgi:hypothetical protein
MCNLVDPLEITDLKTTVTTHQKTIDELNLTLAPLISENPFHIQEQDVTRILQDTLISSDTFKKLIQKEVTPLASVYTHRHTMAQSAVLLVPLL